MAASTPKASAARARHEAPEHASPEKPLKRKVKKAREEAAALERETGEQTFVDGPAVASTSASATKETQWPWVSLTDSSAGRHPPVFTKDGSYFFSIVGSSVKIYSTATGQVVSTLSAAPTAGSLDAAQGHTDVITSLVLNPHNAFQLITGSLDGHIKVWDFLDALLLQTIDVNRPIFHIAAHEKFKGYVFVSVSRPSKKTNKSGKTIEDNCSVHRVSLRPTSATAQLPIQKSTDIRDVGKMRLTRGLSFSHDGAWLVAIGGHKAYVASTTNLKAGFVKFVSPEALTCLTCHPTEDYFATGDVKGNIRLWYCLNESVIVHTPGVESRASTTTLHWHAHPVSALAFTPNGAYLLSGGEESVLVIWQLHSGKKEFVPRVGAPIMNISVSRSVSQEEEYLLGLADASFAFVNSARLKISRTFSRIKLDPAISHDRPSASTSVPLAVHTLSSALILPSSHPSSLQTYSPSASKLLAELEVSPSNRVSRRDEKVLEPSRVERAIVSSSGEWMATIDSRAGDESFRGEVYLKFWQWDRASGFWLLNTRVDQPHGPKKVTGIAFTPAATNSLLLVTTGEDGNIKSWGMRTSKTRNGVLEVFWVARSSLKFREEVPRHVSWSPDGSLLAVALGPYIVLYEPASNTLVQTLTTPECNQLSSVHFIGTAGRYLAAVSLFDIFLWDLVSQTVQWHHRTSDPIDFVIAHPGADVFAVLQRLPETSDKSLSPTRIIIFRPTSATAYRTHTVPFHIRTVAWYPHTHQSESTMSFSLVAITEAWSVVLLGSEIRVQSDEGATAKGIANAAQEPQKRTLLQDVFGKSAFTDFSSSLSSALPETAVAAKSWTSKDVAKMFDAPTYLMPPLESLFDPLLDSFLTLSVADPAISPAAKGAQEEDADMDVDEEEETPITVGERQERIVDWREMNTFIDVFRQHAVKAPPLATHIVANGMERNGTHKSTNGPASAKANGIPRRQTEASHASPEDSPSSNTTPLGVGKKRKMVAA
ncbi:WD40 repeat-like protein [Dentipellis sp. KUC8613]|nr:WD40 repeat-like protein [Dentipellis sp. KUC8613]